MAKKTPKNKKSTKATPSKAPAKAASTRASATTAKKVSRKNATSKRTPNVKVKSNKEVLATIERLMTYNLHDRFSFTFSKQTRAKLVAYGPWLATASVVLISPQLMNLAKNGSLMTISGFFNDIFFNQQSWVILVAILLNILLLVDGLNGLFHKTRRGWTKVYITALITTVYIVSQLLQNLSQPAAPILGLLGAMFILFTLYDIRDYYSQQ